MHAAASDHVTPYDRFALDEATLVALLAAPEPNDSLVEYFGAELHAELVTLARATQGSRPAGRRVYVLPGIMGSQLGFRRGGEKPNDILWLDPIDIQLGRLVELELDDETQAAPLGAMNYTYLKITLSLRAAGFDAVMLDYDWRRDVAALGKLLAERIAGDGVESAAIVAHSMGGLVARAWMRRFGTAHVARIITLGTPHHGTDLAQKAPGDNARQMQRNGEWLARLDADDRAQRRLITSIYSWHDNIIAPQDSCHLPGARNIALHGIGHVALGRHPEIAKHILAEIIGIT